MTQFTNHLTIEHQNENHAPAGDMLEEPLGTWQNMKSFRALRESAQKNPRESTGRVSKDNKKRSNPGWSGKGFPISMNFMDSEFKGPESSKTPITLA